MVVHGDSTLSWALIGAAAVGAIGALVTALTTIRLLRQTQIAVASTERATEEASHLSERGTIDLSDLSSPEVRAQVAALLREAQQRAEADREHTEGEPPEDAPPSQGIT
jgi:hypothetical protein